MLEVELDYPQIMMCVYAGGVRHLQFLKRGARPMYGKDVSTVWGEQIEGALSEYALAKHLNVHWEGVGVAGGNDLAEEEVRVTKLINGSLLLHPKDQDNKRYWLLTGENGKYTIHGYIYGKDGKQEKFWRDPVGGRPAFFVPQSALVKPKAQTIDDKHWLDD